MGQQFNAKCNKCGFSFEVAEGGGFLFNLFHCDKCGRSKDVLISDLSNKKTEDVVGKCKCGGRFSTDAPSRCPKCHSDDYEKDDTQQIFYD